jgi:hypothetical protein
MTALFIGLAGLPQFNPRNRWQIKQFSILAADTPAFETLPVRDICPS